MSMLSNSFNAIKGATSSLVDIMVSTGDATIRIVVDGTKVGATVVTDTATVVAETASNFITKKNK